MPLFGSVTLVRFASQIASQLDGWTIDGHAIMTLNRMRTTEYANLIVRFADSPTAWIRREARRYLGRPAQA